MLSALLRPFNKGDRNPRNEDEDDVEQDPRLVQTSARDYAQHRHATADFTEADDDDDESHEGGQSRYHHDGNRTQEDEDGLNQSIGVLPFFSAGHLGTISPKIGSCLALLTPKPQTRCQYTA